jgi:hypothetical protein
VRGPAVTDRTTYLFPAGPAMTAAAGTGRTSTTLRTIDGPSAPKSSAGPDDGSASSVGHRGPSPTLAAMRAVQITRFGGPDVLDIVDIPEPAPGPGPGPGQKLYAVSTAGVNTLTRTSGGTRFQNPSGSSPSITRPGGPVGRDEAARHVRDRGEPPRRSDPGDPRDPASHCTQGEVPPGPPRLTLWPDTATRDPEHHETRQTSPHCTRKTWPVSAPSMDRT